MQRRSPMIVPDVKGFTCFEALLPKRTTIDGRKASKAPSIL
jgi:hypothetical protein